MIPNDEQGSGSHHVLVRAVMGIALLGATACSPYGLRRLNDGSDGSRDERAILKHAIFIDNDGRALVPSTLHRARPTDGPQIHITADSVVITPDTAYVRYVRTIMTGIRADSLRRGKAPRLLLRVHGGLNSLDESLDHTLDMNEAIMGDGSTDYYPLFVNWESGLISSYGEHLFFLRRGQSHSLRSGEVLFAPFYLAADLGGGIVRAPLSFAKQFRNSARGRYGNDQEQLLCPHANDAARAAAPVASDSGLPSTEARPELGSSERTVCRADLRGVYVQSAAGPRLADAAVGVRPASPADEHVALSRFAYHRSRFESVVDNGLSMVFSWVPTRYFLMAFNSPFRSSLGASYRESSALRRPLTVAGWLPPKALGLIVLDGLGPAAWGTMHRRTRTMIRSSHEFTDARRQVNRYIPESGALPLFLDSLQALLLEHPGYRLTIVGHSMGAIVATEIVRARDSLPIDNIVFMASAASVREFATSVVPYLRSHKQTQFYNLTLHPWSDAREWAKGPVLPYGSLLEWIDTYLANPETVEDMMLGKYDNAVLTASLLPSDVRDRVHIKAFGYQSGTGCGRKRDLPFKHGQFNEAEVPFWRFGFWVPVAAGCEEARAGAALAAASH